MKNKLQKTLPYVDFIAREFQSRKTFNQNYSARAFARDLGISSSFLSSLLNYKVGLSITTGKRIASKLKLSDLEKKTFLTFVSAESHRSQSVRKISALELERLNSSLQFTSTPSCFATVAYNWYYSAILTLVDHYQFTEDSAWISEQLKIPKDIALSTWNHLESMKLVRKNKHGRWERTNKNLINKMETKTIAFHDHYRQMLKKAEISLTESPLNLRDFSSVFLSLTPDDYDFVKQEIYQFTQRLLLDVAKRGGISDRVYCFAIQTFPITPITSENP